MPIERFYIHDLVLQRATLGAPDRSGHREPEFLAQNYVTFKGNVQDRRGREVNGPDLGGTVIVDTLIFAPIIVATEGDRIVYGSRVYDVKWVKDPAGVGHHLEIGAQAILSLVEGVAS